MGKILCIILFINSMSNSIYPQEKTFNIKDQNVELKIERIESQILEIKKNQDTQDSLNKRLDFSKEIINSQDSMFSRYSAFLAILSLVLTILSIALPFITYIFGVKPAKESIELMKKEFQSYLHDTQKIQIENALQNLKSTDSKTRSDASLYLSLNQFYKFSEKDFFEIYNLLESEIEDSEKSVLKVIFSNNSSRYSELYFDKIILSDEWQKNIYYILKYFNNMGFENKINKLLNRIQSSSDKVGTINQILSQLINISKKEFISLLDNPKFVEILNEKEIDSLFKSIEMLVKYNNLEEKFLETYLYKGAALKATNVKKNLEVEAKNNSEKVIADHKNKIRNIIQNKKLTRDKEHNVLDEKGNVIEKSLWVNTMIGPQKVYEAIQIENYTINVLDIPYNENNDA